MELNVKFYLICFLDSLALGLFLPVLATHISTLGGTHTVLGTLATLYTISRLFAGSLTRSWNDTFGKKAALLFILAINYIVYLPFGTTKSYIFLIILRLVVGLTSQTQNICNSFISEFNSKESLPNVQSVTNVLAVAGFVVGPMIAGALYEEADGFYYICRFAAILLFISILIAVTLPNSTGTSSEVNLTFLTRAVSDLQKKFSKIAKLKFKEDWHIIALKFLHSVTATVFFMKFSMLLKVHYKLPSAIIGCTYSYQGSLTFLAPFIIPFINISKSNSATIMSLFIVTAGFMGLCFAKTYDWYLISFIPMILAHTLLNAIWKKVFAERSTKDYEIEGVQDGIGDIASIITPFIFGIFCDLYGVHALQSFTIIPMLLSILIAVITICPPSPIKKVEKKID